MAVAIHPLTPDLWPAFEDLFGKQGACYGCWCTHFRLPPAPGAKTTSERNKDHIRARIEAGPPPGLLAFEGEVRWAGCRSGRAPTCRNGTTRAGAPRRSIRPTPPIRRSGRSPVSSFAARRAARASATIWSTAGIDFARNNGARLLEACPMDQSKDSRSIGLFVGSTRVFRKGRLRNRRFERKAGRPLMRYVL